MANAFFPPGSEINGFVIEVFLSHQNAVANYLATDADNRKYLLSIYEYASTPELEEDITRWSETYHKNVITQITFYTNPYPMAVTPYFSSLTLEEFFMAGNTFSEKEAFALLQLIAGILENLRKRQCTNWHVNRNNLVFTPDRTPFILRDCSGDRPTDSPDNSFRRLALDILGKVDPPLSSHGQTVAAGLRELPVYTDFSEISKLLFSEKKKPALVLPGFKWVSLFLVCILFAAAVGKGIYRFKFKKETSAPRVVTQTLTASHRSQGPVVHAPQTQLPEEKKVPLPLKNDTKSQQPTPQPLAQPAPSEKTSPKPAVQASRKPRPGLLRKKIFRPRAPRQNKPAPPKSLVADAARQGNLRDLRRHIGNGNNVNLPDSHGKTALQYAAASNWIAMIKLLHEAGAKITPEVLKSAGNRKTREYLNSLLTPKAVINTKHPVLQPARPTVLNTRNWKRPEKKNWHITLETAVQLARPQRKKILVLFTGSDWCGPCKALYANVLNSSDFRRLSRKFEFVYINFPHHEKQPPAQKSYNEKLRNDLRGGGGVPNLLILDHTGKKLLGRIGGYRPKESYIKELKKQLR